MGCHAQGKHAYSMDWEKILDWHIELLRIWWRVLNRSLFHPILIRSLHPSDCQCPSSKCTWKRLWICWIRRIPSIFMRIPSRVYTFNRNALLFHRIRPLFALWLLQVQNATSLPIQLPIRAVHIQYFTSILAMARGRVFFALSIWRACKWSEARLLPKMERRSERRILVS